jgi:hypothetical protein
MPISGFHSTIDKPDSVRRVIAPITAMANTMPQQNSSQNAMARDAGAALAAASRDAGYVTDDKL